ncbi:MAG: AAA family ATPase [Intrasporangium sp.]|uniref:AAA family ATPase n=1 Tax=Intrasporangium sp. TaxID=1925024 RepID=UPI003F81C7E4
MALLFYLVGPPAVGKLTVARELEQRTGAIVVDNHLINDSVFVPMAMHRGNGDLAVTDDLRRRVLDVVHEATELAPPSFSHVFTNWLPDEPENERLVHGKRDLARRRGARFVPVWLSAHPEVLAGRIVNPQRSVRAKLMDPEVLRDLLTIPQLPAPSDAIVLDTTDLEAHEVADAILASV